MVGLGFCKVCEIRIFNDEILNQDYFIYGTDVVCRECMDEMHKCEKCGESQPYCSECI